MQVKEWMKEIIDVQNTENKWNPWMFSLLKIDDIPNLKMFFPSTCFLIIQHDNIADIDLYSSGDK